MRDNLIEILNEIFILLIISYLFAINNQEAWTDSATNWFMNILSINSLLVVFIMIGNYSFLLYIHLFSFYGD